MQINSVGELRFMVWTTSISVSIWAVCNWINDNMSMTPAPYLILPIRTPPCDPFSAAC